MLKQPLAILLALALAPAATAQGPPQPEPVGSTLVSALKGDLRGPQRTPGGVADGWIRIESVLDGQWVRCIGASLVDGRPRSSFVQMMREDAEGKVSAWHFDSTGEMSRWTGAVSERGMNLEWHDSEGRLLARQDWEFENGDCDFRLSRRPDPDSKFRPLVTGLLQRGTGRPSWRPSEEALERLEESPYGYYLGSFRGKESSLFGESEGMMRTEGILDGHWFHTDYASRAAGVTVYAGQGFVRCDQAGRYRLHWFDSFGDAQQLDGRITEEGAEAVLLDERGEVLERHEDRRTATGYRFVIRRRGEGAEDWQEFMTATYARVAEPSGEHDPERSGTREPRGEHEHREHGGS